jgi:hypothetical protein
MTKFRIIKEHADGVDQFYVEYRKTLSLGWKKFCFYYKSEFADMPGWWSDHVNTREEAIFLLEKAKKIHAPTAFPDGGVVYEYVERPPTR